MEQNKELQNLISEDYIPSAIERKKTVLMYFFVGILISLVNIKKITNYEKYHLKQAIGWWTIFFILLVVFIVFYFIPYVKFIPIFILLILFIIWVIYIKQAWEGFYTIQDQDKSKILFPFFAGVGTWILNIFDYEDKERIGDD